MFFEIIVWGFVVVNPIIWDFIVIFSGLLKYKLIKFRGEDNQRDLETWSNQRGVELLM